MALMYDMETVNRAMTEAAKLYDPKSKSIRVKRVLDIFAGMKPVQEVHGRWEVVQVWKDNPQTTLKCSICKACQPIYEHDEWTYCPFCGTPMDGRVEA